MIYRMIRPVPVVLVTLLVAACQGTDNRAFNQLGQEGTEFLEGVSGLPVTSASAVPTSGSVSYQGVAGFVYDEPVVVGSTYYDLLADVQITASFASNTVTGSISQFNSPEGAVSGTVPVTDGVISGGFVAANATGTIVDGGTVVALDLDMAGVFRGDQAQAITGSANGSYTPEGGATGQIFGVFGVDAD